MQKYIIFHYIYQQKQNTNENEKKIPCIFLYFLLGFWFLFFLGDFENIYSEIAEKDAEIKTGEMEEKLVWENGKVLKCYYFCYFFVLLVFL